MSNLPVLANAQLPAHLQGRVGVPSVLTQAVLAGMTGGVPKISIKQSRFRIVEGGEEYPLDTLHLDCIIVGAVAGVSKVYYAKAYNPKDEPAAPDCQSVIGDRPSADATTPQAASCAVCPHNVWGSKITPQGNETKACADSRRVAVVAADDPTGTIYLFTIPAASMKALGKYAKELGMRGVSPEMVRTRVTFDSSADFPKLEFGFAGFLDAESYAAVSGRIDTPEVKDVLGLLGQAAAPAAIPAPAAQPQPTPAPAPQPVAQPAPQPTPEPAAPAAPSAPKRGFGKGAAAPAAAAQPAPQPTPAPAAPAAPAYTVAQGDGLASLEAQLDGLLNGPAF